VYIEKKKGTRKSLPESEGKMVGGSATKKRRFSYWEWQGGGGKKRPLQHLGGARATLVSNGN